MRILARFLSMGNLRCMVVHVRHRQWWYLRDHFRSAPYKR